MSPDTYQSFSLALTNTDTSDLQNVVVKEQVHPFLVVSDVILGTNASGMCDEPNQLVRCAVNVPANQTVTITVRYTIDGDPISGDESHAYQIPDDIDGSLFMFLFENGIVLRGNTVPGHRNATLDMMDGKGENLVPIDNKDGKKNESKNSMDLGSPFNFSIHTSCADKFKDGWGKNDGPDKKKNSDWRISAYYIIMQKGKKNNQSTEKPKTCGRWMSDLTIVYNMTATFLNEDGKEARVWTADTIVIDADSPDDGDDGQSSSEDGDNGCDDGNSNCGDGEASSEKGKKKKKRFLRSDDSWFG